MPAMRTNPAIGVQRSNSAAVVWCDDQGRGRDNDLRVSVQVPAGVAVTVRAAGSPASSCASPESTVGAGTW